MLPGREVRRSLRARLSGILRACPKTEPTVWGLGVQGPEPYTLQTLTLNCALPKPSLGSRDGSFNLVGVL